ncbi:DUF2235 domain-containing protein [Alcaligenaceae bacterium B3P038]|nr:DUF2235 domain-containing protein [Alcaligenaceae bacterium B3P038]
MAAGTTAATTGVWWGLLWGVALGALCGLPMARAAGCGPSEIGAPCPGGADGPAPNVGIGNPVHAVTGNKYQRETDLPRLPGSGGVALIRHFNSRDPRPGPLGRGWALDLDDRLYLTGTRAQIVTADGTRHLFDCPLVYGDCRAAGAAAGTLQRTGPTSQWRPLPGSLTRFDSGGRTVAIAGNGRALTIERAARPRALRGEILAVRGANDASLTFHYDLHGRAARLAAIDTPHGRFAYRYGGDTEGGAPGHLENVVRPDGMQRRYHYEAAFQAGDAHRLTGISVVATDGAVWRQRSWRYDRYGRVIHATRGAPDDAATAAAIAYVRTPLGDGDVGLTEVREAAGLTQVHTAQVGGRFVVTQVDGAGCTGCAPPGLRMTYDREGRVTRASDVTLARDAAGRIRDIAIDHPGWPGLRQTFDSGGRLTAWYTTATGRETRRYDLAGRLNGRHYANGDRLQISHDAAGRPVDLLATTPRSPYALRTRIAWRDGLPVSIHHPYETEYREYDARGRLIGRTAIRPATLARFPGKPPNARLLSLAKAPAGAGAGASARLAASRPAAAVQYRDGYAWDDAGRLIRHDLPEGGALHYTWVDDTHTAATITWTDANGADWPVWQATDPAVPNTAAPAQVHLDDEGRVMLETHRLRPGWGRAYVYDAASRLVGARITADSDAAANPSGAVSGQYWYAWQRTGAAAGTRDPAGSALAEIARDASGLPLRVGSRTLVYGPDRRLQAVQGGRAIEATYAHNAFGEQILARIGNRTAHRLYSGNRWVADAQASRSGLLVLRRAIYAGSQPVGWIVYDEASTPATPHGRLLRVHADAVGAPWRLTDGAGRVVWQGDHSPTGALIAATGDLEMPLRLPGQRADAVTGWHDNYLRTYDPAAGHYLEPDPMGPLPGNSVYGYAAQQPRRFVDPLGLLLFAFDGTRNDPVTQTNVMLFAQHYTGGDVFYHRGPGRRDRIDWDGIAASSASEILEKQWNHLLDALSAHQDAGGAGALAIDLVGYSRGAALARDFANRIAARVRDGRFFLDDGERGIISACVDLRFIGLFDSVTQFGLLGADDRDFNMAVKSAWRWVAHAVALHERRMIFPVTSLIGAGGNTVEAPFLGAHSDVGGGTRVATGGDISNVALQWMAWQARVGGVDLEPLARHLRQVSTPLLHDNRVPRPVFQDFDSGDRTVQDTHGLPLYQQEQDPTIGGAQRRAVEPYIDRQAPGTDRDGSVAGRVDMRGYRRWLRDTLGLQIGR